MGSTHEEDDGRSRVPSRYLSRRSSEGETWAPISSAHSSSSSRDRRHHGRKHRKSRSWNPSPYVSEEEDEDADMTREEKKARIKAEIARRRQQIQERAGLHHELLRISRLREGGSENEKHSVLKSVDQLLRDQYGRYESSPSAYSRQAMYSSRNLRRGPGGVVVSPCASEEDRSIERIASTFRSDDYTSLLYERLGEMSPMADSDCMGSELGNTPAAMPLLEDMPTRSRRLLEDLGSAPISRRGDGGHGSSSGSNMKGKYGVGSQGHMPYRNVL